MNPNCLEKYIDNIVPLTCTASIPRVTNFNPLHSSTLRLVFELQAIFRQVHRLTKNMLR